MYYESNGTPTEWHVCSKCGKSAQFSPSSVLLFWDANRKPVDPVDAFCREHYPAGVAAFDAEQRDVVVRQFENKWSQQGACQARFQ